MNTQIAGSLISHMSGLVKMHGGINLAQGLPGFPPPPELLNELKTVIPENCHQYPHGDGDPELVNAISLMYQSQQKIADKQILILQGATEAISLTYLYLINKFGNNWNSLAFDPVYESYSHLPKIYGNELIRASFNSDDSIPWDSLSEMISQHNVKLFFVNSPGNPYSRIWTESEINRLLTMAEKENFYVVFP
ncbi:MAG: pyridoxal phosphate-dependent aminotransferase, partial [Bacteroidales bacterium]|nr:pyridoxal phosphate-dependent aminotransferase [Bacteroidales bacterium]